MWLIYNNPAAFKLSLISLCPEKQVMQDAFETHQLNRLLVAKGIVHMLKRKTEAGEMHVVWYTYSDVRFK